MFGRRRRFLPGRRGGGGLGLVLLGMQLINLFNYFSRQNEFLPVTIGVLAVNLLAYFQPGSYHWPSIQQACISVQQVWFQRQWKRIFYAPFFHASDFHLYYNMASFIWKGISLEKQFGSGYFAYLVAVFSVVTNLVYLAINFALAEFLDQWSAVQSCAVGFSGVLFALKVVTTHLQPPGMTMLLGFFPIPMRLACWAELVLISLLFPNVSFVGHLSGILVGLAWVYGPLRAVMEIPLSAINGTVLLARPYLQALLSGEYRSVLIACGFLLLLLLAFLIEILPAGGGEEGGAGRQADGRSYTYAAGSTGRQPPEDRPARRTRPAPRPMPSYTSYTYASGTTGHTDGHGGGREGMDHGSDEEDLQEAIRLSLADDRTHLPSGRPSDHTSTQSEARETEHEDREFQVALERSIGESRERDLPPPPPGEPLERPPPYNPAFPHSTTAPPTTTRDIGFVVSDDSDLLASETIPVGWRVPPTVVGDTDSGSGLVQRRGIRSEGDSQAGLRATTEAGSVQQDGHRGQSGEGLGAGSGSLSREALRAARMQRFGSLTQQRAPLDSVARRGSWK